MKKKIVKSAGFLLNFFNILMFFSMRPCWSGISKTLGYTNGGNEFFYNLPVYLCILLLCIFIVNLALLVLKKDGKLWPILFAVIGFVFFAGILVIIKLGAADYMRFIWPTFFDGLLIADIIAVIAFLLFVYPKLAIKNSKAFKCVILAICVAGACFYLADFEINGFETEPVVYAVEDEYQIVYSTKADSVAWVTVDGQEYYDLYAGSMKDGYIHKICIPMDTLNDAGSYEVHAEKVVYRGPFGSFFGKEIQQEITFYAPNFDDGVQYISFSDVHENKKAVLQSANIAGNFNTLHESEDAYYPDFVVFAGDMVSDVESFDDANFVNEVLGELTGGSIPVIYARGNHECKGEYSDELYKFVGSKDQKFYYTVKMGSVYVLVNDIGEDHEDDWWEFSGTAQFDSYRAEQLDFIQAEIDSGEYKNYDYRLHICHIPPVYVNYRRDQAEFKEDFTALLNQLDLDMSLCGHQHEILIFEPGAVASEPNSKLSYNVNYAQGSYNGYLTDFNFPCLMVSKPGYTQSESDDDKNSLIILQAEAHKGSETALYFYRNSKGEAVSVYNPFADIFYGNCIEIDSNGAFTHKNEY